MGSRIMVPLDGSEASERVLPLLQRLLDCGQADSAVLVRVEEPITEVVFDYALKPEVVQATEEHARREAEDYLRRMEGDIDWHGLEHRTVVLTGHPEEVLARFALREEIDRVLMGVPERTGLRGRARRWAAERVARSFHLPVTLCAPPACPAPDLEDWAC